mgnify:FL=1|jgi:hypothetical protein|tara:strand:- start:6932 stop:7636 length:705 start_codon:yes stop_codon:yes gene_type:complete
MMASIKENLLSLLPTAARKYIQAVLLGEKTPITEKDFTGPELEAIKQVILLSNKEIGWRPRGDPLKRDVMKSGLKGDVAKQSFATTGEKRRNLKKDWPTIKATPGRVDYSAYDKSRLTGGPDASTFGIGGLETPIGNIKHTLGRFPYEMNEEGDIVVKDKYDFSPYLPPNVSTTDRILEAIQTLGYSEIRHNAAQRLPEGTGPEVEVNIPREAFSPQELKDLFERQFELSALDI